MVRVISSFGRYYAMHRLASQRRGSSQLQFSAACDASFLTDWSVIIAMNLLPMTMPNAAARGTRRTCKTRSGNVSLAFINRQPMGQGAQAGP
jgi:hypothetical protein